MGSELVGWPDLNRRPLRPEAIAMSCAPARARWLPAVSRPAKSARVARCSRSLLLTSSPMVPLHRFLVRSPEPRGQLWHRQLGLARLDRLYRTTGWECVIASRTVIATCDPVGHACFLPSAAAWR